MSLWVTLDCAGSQSSLPSYNEATEEPAKKKIIPVQSDFESSPSPEDPSSPLPSPPLYHKNRSNTNLKILFEYHGQICSQLMIDRFRMSQSTMNLARHDSGEVSKAALKTKVAKSNGYFCAKMLGCPLNGLFTFLMPSLTSHKYLPFGGIQLETCQA